MNAKRWRRRLGVFLAAGVAWSAAVGPVQGVEETASQAPKLFTMEFREADLKDVLRLLAQESGLNILVGEKVAGKVTVSFREVTLKQALDAILESFGYSYAFSGDIVLVGSEKPKAEFETRAIPIHYSNDVGGVADLTNLAESLKPILSGEEGSGISVVQRTNTLVVTDLPEFVEKVAALARELDQQTPQVKIEARIVEVKDIYQEEIGIQWGAGFTADASHGNALGYNFPNSINVQGTQGDGNYLVNLPAANPVGGIGIAMGHIANTLSLDLRLSAMEKLEKLKILSTPSVLAVQNREATIKVGEQIPFEASTTNVSGTTTTEIEFKDVVLQLNVVPYVIPDGRIFLTVTLNKDTRGEAVTTIEGRQEFAIDTKEVSTRVLLRDGETTVIGGLYTQQKQKGANEVPGLSRIPLLGWLFRSRSISNVRNELLVFLTPRIQTP